MLLLLFCLFVMFRLHGRALLMNSLSLARARRGRAPRPARHHTEDEPFDFDLRCQHLAHPLALLPRYQKCCGAGAASWRELSSGHGYIMSNLPPLPFSAGPFIAGHKTLSHSPFYIFDGSRSTNPVVKSTRTPSRACNETLCLDIQQPRKTEMGADGAGPMMK